jgi:hypothetical protein
MLVDDAGQLGSLPLDALIPVLKNQVINIRHPVIEIVQWRHRQSTFAGMIPDLGQNCGGAVSLPPDSVGMNPSRCSNCQRVATKQFHRNMSAMPLQHSRGGGTAIELFTAGVRAMSAELARAVEARATTSV